jgi:hypothetical protein
MDGVWDFCGWLFLCQCRCYGCGGGGVIVCVDLFLVKREIFVGRSWHCDIIGLAGA